MNEQVARNVVLVRAIESTDVKREILSEEDRGYASRSARELAQWQASDTGEQATLEQFLQQRSEQVLRRIAERVPAFAALARRRNGIGAFNLLLPVAGLLAGAGFDRIGDPHRVDLLSAPLLLILGWNLLVYLWMIVWACLPSRRYGWRNAAWVRRLEGGKTAFPRSLPHALAGALFAFGTEWAQLSAALTSARLARAIHLAAALFALGAMLSLYARGILSQYAAGWESTFLDAGQVHAILSIVFAPAIAVFHLQGFSIADIEALRFAQTASPAGGARWVHLYAATLFLFVVLPRMLLAAAAHWKARRLERNFPLDLRQPYFRKLAQAMDCTPGVLRVLPYSFTLDEARDRGLNAVAVMLLGEQARVMLRPCIPYGEEMDEALRDMPLDDGSVSLTAVLFNLSATPEKENHGALLKALKALSHRSSHGIGVLIDESGYLERIGAQAGGKARLAERIHLWQQFCRFHGMYATIVNLRDPGKRPLDAGAGLTLSDTP